MLSFKIGAVLAVAITISAASVVAPALAPAVVAPPLIRYTQVAPQNVHPFAAQVSTFTRGLNIFAAPYAAGVLPSPPAIIQRSLLPAPVPAAVAPIPTGLAPVPAAIGPVPAGPVAPLFPQAYAGIAPHAYGGIVPHAHLAAQVAPVHGGLVARAWPSLLAAPEARSVHAVAPALSPALPAAPLLG